MFGRESEKPHSSESSQSKYFVTDPDNPATVLRKRNCSMTSSPPFHLKKSQRVQNETDVSPNNCFELISKLESHSFKQKRSIGQVQDSIENETLVEQTEDFLLCPSSSSDGEFLSESDITELNMKELPALSQKSFQNKTPKPTPFEKQYLDLKNQYPDAILFVQHGNMYKLFGEDAKIASQELNLAIYPSKTLMLSSFPSPRLPSHIHTLVMKGYKVGVVKETDTTALKHAEGKTNELFSRELCALYTRSTFIGSDMYSTVGYNIDNSNVSFEDVELGYLVCICENIPLNNKQHMNIGLVAVELSTGDLTYSLFEDVSMRTKLETCLNHLNASEILHPSSLSSETMKLLKAFSFDRSVRLETVSSHLFEHPFALNYVSSLVEGKSSLQGSCSAETIQKVLSLPSMIVSCISALSMYLTQFKLENVMKNLRDLKPLSTDEHMMLNTATLEGLEIFKNRSTKSTRGSLFDILNKTVTKFGERLLKNWITKPLKNLSLIEERLSIVTNIIHSESIVYDVLKSALKDLPDLDKLLCCVFHEKCSCLNFLKLIEGLNKIKTHIFSVADKIQDEIKSPRIKTILSDILMLLKDVHHVLHNIRPEAARIGDKTKVFIDSSMFPDLKQCQDEIISLDQKLNNLKPYLSKTLGLPNIKFATIFGKKYLVEVPNTMLDHVPADWLKVNSTKQVSRFRTPEIINLNNQLQQNLELVNGLADNAWIVFLRDFSSLFCKYKRVISYVAEIDCYLSLEKVANERNYCRPTFANVEESFCIHQGIHPLLGIENGLEKQFVANDVDINDTVRCIIVTGPNMGGKSTYMRQTALISIMAQMGSYVSADSATLPVFDNIFVRMGGVDDMALGKSTFMVEMSETSEILSKVSSTSLVILDELGRGTSTHDGTAIAYATLRYLVSRVKCYVMFATHYPEIVELKNQYPENIKLIHMGFYLNEAGEDNIQEKVVFLYNAVEGKSEKSYGINVAALAGISKEILSEAKLKSQEIELMGKIKRKVTGLIKNSNPRE